MAARETAGFTTRLIVEETRRWGGDEAVERLLELAGETRPVAELTDERAWSSYDAKIALFQAAAKLTGEPRIARDMGAAVLRAQIGRPLLAMLTLLGSPPQLLRSVGRASAKFNTVADMRQMTGGRRSARIGYRLRSGYRPSRHDCDYNIGLLSQVPAIFGLPPAEVAHPQCQVDGAKECIYELTWRRRRRWFAGRETPMAGVHSVQERFDELQQTVADLVAATDLDTVLPVMAHRAGGAVHGERYLIIVQVEGEPTPRVHSEGFADDEAKEIGLRLLSGRPMPPGTGSALCAELKSARRSHGVLAVFLRSGHAFLDSEQQLLDSYARLGASALDAATAVSAAQERRQTAEVLLAFARQLLTAEGSDAVTRLTAEAALSIVGADRSTVWLWNEEADALTLAGQAGWPQEQAELLAALVVRRGDAPELNALLEDPTVPRLFDAGSSQPFLRNLIGAFGSRVIAVVPMATPDRLYGIVIAAWQQDGTEPPLDKPPFDRMAGVADQATTALQRDALLEQVRRQASRDELTGLPNRRQLGDLLQETVQRVGAEGPAGLLFLDLDRFKHVNDTLGHSAGDLLLQVIAGRLQHSVRMDDVVARLGGDEFTVLLPRMGSAADLTAVADAILASFAQPVMIADQPIFVSPSMGGVLITADRSDPAELLRDADLAMYAAKRAGGGRLVLYDEALASEINELALEAELRQAIVAGQLTVLYQPQIHLADGAVVGAEALVRWDHPERGRLTPAQFLPLAEETGLIVALDLLVLQRAARQAAAWHDQGRTLRVAVNISARTLGDDQLLPVLVDLLAETRLPSGALELELTESGAFSDADQVAATITMLGELGVSFALDDLGTGHNTLRRVQELPVRRLKIDRSFVTDLVTGGPGAYVVEAVIQLASRLGIPALAEGVETLEQAAALRVAGCCEAQGHLYGRPGPAADVTAAERRPRLAPA